MSCHVAVDIDSDRQPCNVRGHGKHVYSQRGGPAAKALRADAERIDALDHQGKLPKEQKDSLKDALKKGDIKALFREPSEKEEPLA